MNAKKKVKTHRSPNVSITIRKPDSKTRKSFSLTSVVVNANGTRTQKKLKSSEIDSINANYKSKTIDYNQALVLVEKVKDTELERLKIKLGFNQSEGSTINESNRRLATKFLEEKYSKRISVKAVTKERTHTEINACLKIIGGHSLFTDDQTTLQHVLNDSKLYSKEYTRRLVCRINSLLTLAGRGFKLSKPANRKKRRILHVTESKHPLFIAQLNREIDKVAARVIFNTGLRIGELFPLEDDDIDWNSKQIDITKQLTREFRTEDPKCGKDRTAIYPKSIERDLEKWLDFTESHKLENRNGMSKRFLATSRRQWGKSKLKDISPHDLRRSFAIHMITEKGLSITEVATLLGDTEKVTQDYYAGYAASDSMLSKLSKKLG